MGRCPVTTELVEFLRASSTTTSGSRAIDSTPWRQGTTDSPGWDRDLVYVEGDERVIHDLTEEESRGVVCRKRCGRLSAALVEPSPIYPLNSGQRCVVAAWTMP
jgi:hypothetical protein